MRDLKRVVVAMSGGVDSSVAAALLVEQGYETIGMMLRLWSEPGGEDTNRCCTPDAMAQARRVAGILGIPFYAVDARQAFHGAVVSRFIDGYAHGTTPNPCMHCNRQIRWGLLLREAEALDAQYLATGHYARVERTRSGSYELQRGTDPSKDQSYILHVLNQEQLARTIFPLGNLTKPEVRQIAQRFNLPVADRSESQDLCFLGNGDYRSFLRRNAPEVSQPGAIVNPEGNPLGVHEGLAFFTIGQRRGLGINSAEPLYVLEKDIQNNRLVVGAERSLGRDRLTASDVNWVSGGPPERALRLQVKIRYKAKEAWAEVTPQEGGTVRVQFDQPQRDITPGQAVVFYQGKVCLGGGVIDLAKNP